MRTNFVEEEGKLQRKGDEKGDCERRVQFRSDEDLSKAEFGAEGTNDVDRGEIEDETEGDGDGQSG